MCAISACWQDCGVSASFAFQKTLREKFTLTEQIDVPRMFYTCDDLTIWKRRPEESLKFGGGGIEVNWG